MMRLRRAVLGSVANQLLKLAPCDMLIVPQGTVAAVTAPRFSVGAR